MSFHWIDLFRILEQIDEQIYRLILFTKYAHLHSVFFIQLLENYCHCHNNIEFMIMSDFEDFQNEWDVKKVKNKWWIQNIIYYLIKWADWFSEYNFYELISHLTDVLKIIADYEWKLKHKHKKTSTDTEHHKKMKIHCSEKSDKNSHSMCLLKTTFFYHLSFSNRQSK